MTHSFAISLAWRNSPAPNGETLRGYSRNGELSAQDHAPIGVSAAGGFSGDITQWNPEELLMGALAQCHMLSFLWVAQSEGVTVVSYTDAVSGEMDMRGGVGAMTEVTLNPTVVVDSEADAERIGEFHERAKAMCVIRSSVNFPVLLESNVEVSSPRVH